MNPAEAWVLIHVAATWAMVGVIWTIQLLQYPLMANVPGAGFVTFEEAHQRRVVRVLALFAPLEVVSAAAVALMATDVPRWLSVGSGALLVALWAATGAHYAPLHGRLGRGFDADMHRRLVRDNWARTALWTVRGAAAVGMVAAIVG